MKNKKVVVRYFRITTINRVTDKNLVFPNLLLLKFFAFLYAEAQEFEEKDFAVNISHEPHEPHAQLRVTGGIGNYFAQSDIFAL